MEKRCRREAWTTSAILLALACPLGTTTLARADAPPGPPPTTVETSANPSDPCTVLRACSAIGVDCRSTDRSCQDDAVSRGLEVVCERPEVETRHFVYCPPGGASRDSKYVWVLLVVAMSIAAGGSIIAWALLKKS